MVTEQSVAIVGVGGLFPSSPTLERFWDTIVSNVNTSRQPPAGRWLLPVDDVYDSEVGKADKVYSKQGCFLDDEEDIGTIPGLAIDPHFLRQLDPMFRLLLRVAQQTVDSLSASFERTRSGIIIGNLALPSEKSSQLARTYLGRTFMEQLSEPPLTLPEEDVDPINRYVAGLPAAIMARAFALQGTCYTVDAACASSLYAIKLAVDELLSGRADAMFAGGLSRPDSLYTQMGFSQLRAVSPTGTCSPFDRNGNGLVVGEGCGLVLLKRTEDAIRDGDHIRAVIRGIGLSSDLGGNLLAPQSEGQLRAMRSAYKEAGWSPADVDLIECHATGTPVGDAVEFSSLQQLWRDDKWRPGQCVIGSVKANIGHLLTAAGSAALIKSLLALEKQTLPPTVNFSAPAAGIDLDNSPFRILERPLRWEPRKGGQPRRAAVSAFGFGGINAHLLLEEWVPQAAAKKTVRLHPAMHQRNQPVAIVGIGTHFGPWDSLDKFQQRVLGGDPATRPQLPQNWWGAEKTHWLKEKGLNRDDFGGYFVSAVSAKPGQFRIPPKELAEMLPRQLLMLKVAADALKDAGLTSAELLFTGVFIGAGLDLNATNFSFRWGLQKYAPLWAEQLGLDLDEQELADWIEQLRTAAGPPLTANRTMGALGSVVASRIVKEFKIGGPSFTLSSEENSGLRALEVGIHALQEGSINRAVVGAVDLGGDLRNVIGSHSAVPFSAAGNSSPLGHHSNGRLIGEGAAAVILKRLEDARQDGDHIYAIVNGVGTAIGGEIDATAPSAEIYSAALERACGNSHVDPTTISYLETDGSGVVSRDRLEATVLSQVFSAPESRGSCRIGSVKGDIGHTGAAAGLAAVVKTALCLEQQIVPPIRHLDTLLPDWIRSGRPCFAPEKSHYWLHNRADGPRRALVSGLGFDGSVSHLILEEGDSVADSDHPRVSRPLGLLTEGLFVVAAEDRGGLEHELSALRKFMVENGRCPLDELARRWLQQSPLDPHANECLALIAASREMLGQQLDFVLNAFRNTLHRSIGLQGGEQLDPALRDRVFYTTRPLGPDGKVVFIFPGSGNHFAGMGEEFSALWPVIYRQQDRHSDYLADQYLADQFWRKELSETVHHDHNALVISHVAQCTALHDLITRFGLRPQLISGYSLGESSGLFSSSAWRDRDGMLRRLEKSPLFTSELAGECRAAQRVWNLPPGSRVDWLLGIVNLPAEKVKAALKGREQVYLLIINTPRECVIGGQRGVVEQLVSELGCHFIPLRGVTTVHCEVVKAVADAYRNLHLFDVTPPAGIDYYSCALGKKYPLTAENAADVILAQALDTIDYPRVINQLYSDGGRIFLEVGPGTSCSRMINSILGERPHLTRSICAPGLDPTSQLLRLLGSCLAERVAVDLSPLYPQGADFVPETTTSARDIVAVSGGESFSPALPDKKIKIEETNSYTDKVESVNKMSEGSSQRVVDSSANDLLIADFNRSVAAGSAAHEAYLQFSRELEQALSNAVSLQTEVLQKMVEGGESIPLSAAVQTAVPAPPAVVPDVARQVAYDRDMCREFAVGSVAKMLGPDFAEVDTYPTRVRLPDGPLMLVDRIMAVEGVPRSMSHGRVVTEHDVTADRWYLDGGRIPTCIAVEAGQADLFLSGFLGIDFMTKGKAVYRLLDAVVTFHRSLPAVGETIHYDIKIDEFFRQDQTYLFRFNFEGTVNGEPLLSMRHGCAGFFTAEDLAAGKGIVHTKLDLMPQPGVLPPDWRELLPLAVEAYSDEQIDALYNGDLAGCFGPRFAALPFVPYTLPGKMLKLVDRVIKLDPRGGRYGLGQITAEMDIAPDDWFLTCHFVDDQVMPGTLMYECCMHTLRIYLLRMGWVGEAGHTWCEPVPGVASGLKCRGQVIASTKTVTYQVSIKELGYRPEPYAIVDALMFADGHPIVEIPDMSVRLAGLDRARVESLWSTATAASAVPVQKQILYDTDKITAFAIGKPSEAFGEPYRIFDQQRKIARLPGPPFQFLDRIVAIDGEPWQLVEGAAVVAEYDVPPDAWYFAANRQDTMPFSVLLEIGLQPCGWLAAYLGSALTSETDLSFRNLDGHAVQHRPVTPQSGTLTIAVTITRIASSGGMIIQSYDFAVSDSHGPVYTGDTVFGFFSKESLAQQVGVRGATLYQPTAAELAAAEAFSYPPEAPFPETRMRMIDTIELYSANGGEHGLGYIRGTKRVDPDEWFFKAHFYQDPVCPGSLGLESYLQLLKIIAARRWGVTAATQFETVVPDLEHSWNYRGQIIPSNEKVVVEATVTAVDDEKRQLRADGFLAVDGKIIYQMKDFSLQLL